MCKGLKQQVGFNPFYATDLFRYPLKTLENQRFSDVFRGIKREQWHEMGYNLGAFHWKYAPEAAN